MRYAFGSPRQGFQRRRIANAMLSDSIRHDDPSVNSLLTTIEKAQTLAQLVLAVWPLARVLARQVVESLLAERAQWPIAWPPCPTCGTALRSKGFAQRQLTSLRGPIRWRRRVGRCPHGCDIPQVAPSMRSWGCSPISGPAGNSSAWAVRWRSLCRLPPRRGCWDGLVVGW